MAAVRPDGRRSCPDGRGRGFRRGPGSPVGRGFADLGSSLVALVRIPNTLRSLTGGVGELTVDGADLAAVLVSLEARHPGFEERLMTDDGRLQGFVNVFIDDTECRRLEGLAASVGADTVVSIVPAVAGG